MATNRSTTFRLERPTWLYALAGVVGTALGVVIGGLLGLAAAHALGVRDTVDDYGPGFKLIVGGALLFGVLGCYAALRTACDPKAVPTLLLVVPLLPGSVAVVDPVGRAVAGALNWDFGTMIPVAIVLYVAVPLAASVAARYLAGFFSRIR